MSVLMQCGCITSATDGAGDPICITHWGVKDGYNKIETADPDLMGRFAVCTMCRKENESNPKLPFFKKGEGEKDSFYCGCRGWS